MVWLRGEPDDLFAKGKVLQGLKGLVPSATGSSFGLRSHGDHIFEYLDISKQSAISSFLNSNNLLLPETMKEKDNEINEYLKESFEDEINALETRGMKQN